MWYFFNDNFGLRGNFGVMPSLGLIDSFGLFITVVSAGHFDTDAGGVRQLDKPSFPDTKKRLHLAAIYPRS